MSTSTLLPPTEPDTASTGPAPIDGPLAAPPNRGRLATLVRGQPDDPAWTRPAVLALLAATAVLYLWDLSASGDANSFYAAAVQSGSHSWKAWFFGSLDSASSITVDKPPASLWVMGLSARIFGFTSWSLLVPQALEGVAAVGLLYATVKRVSGPVAGLIAGAALAVTPAAVLMFRFDNPDALLVLLMVAAAYAVTRALEYAGTRWLLFAGVLIGFAFLTKMMQGFLVLPAFALVYLVAAPASLRRRIGQVLAAALAVVVGAGWWVLIVGLWPASSRPYIGGSTDNTVLNLVFGYNGLGRLFGSSGGGGGGGAGFQLRRGHRPRAACSAARWATRSPGCSLRPWSPWSPALWATGRAPRTDRTRAALILWGGWLIVTGLVFSYMQGTIHPYYTVALAPSIAGVVAVGGAALWRRRDELTARLGLSAIVLAAGGWSYVLLARTSIVAPGAALPGRDPDRRRRRRVRRAGRPDTAHGQGCDRQRCAGRHPRHRGVRSGHGGHGPHRQHPQRRPGRGVHRYGRRLRRGRIRRRHASDRRHAFDRRPASDRRPDRKCGPRRLARPARRVPRRRAGRAVVTPPRARR